MDFLRRPSFATAEYAKVTIRNTETGLSERTLELDSRVDCVEFLPGKDLVLIGLPVGAIMMWNATYWKEIWSLDSSETLTVNLTFR
jgi:hypothetical protein